jgi:hypothetical protein
MDHDDADHQYVPDLLAYQVGTLVDDMDGNYEDNIVQLCTSELVNHYLCSLIFQIH